MKKYLITPVLAGLFFVGCITGLNSPTTPAKMAKQLHQQASWEIQSIHITEVDSNITVVDTVLEYPGTIHFFKEEDQTNSSFPKKKGLMNIFGDAFPIKWGTYSTDKEDPTPSLYLLFFRDVGHFQAEEAYVFDNTFWNEEDELHLVWGESATSPSLGVHHSLEWEIILRAKD